MPRFYFNLAGDTPAHDVIGHECADDTEARVHARELAHNLATDKPHLVRDGNAVVILTEDGDEIDRVMLMSA